MPLLYLYKLNIHVEEQKFMTETLSSICRMIRRKDYLKSLDLQDEFMNILVYKQCQKYFRLHWNVRCFQFRNLTFGISLSPLVFTKILRPVLKWARSNEVRFSAYFDDLLIMGASMEEYVAITHRIYSKLLELGFKVNDDKSSTSPPQYITNLKMGSPNRGQQVTERCPEENEMSGELYWEIPIDVYSPTSRMSYASPTSGAQESFSVDFKIMEIDSDFNENSHTEPAVKEKTAEVIKKAFVLARNSGNRIFHRIQRLCLGSIRNQTPECCGDIGVSLLRKNNHILVCEGIRGKDIPKTNGNIRRDLVTLSEDQYLTTSDIRFVSAEPIRHSKKIDR
ncbi:hypothetical protein AYI68_g3594 [Smittium mucronatum]|uniref:Reverse transcriptase domain-containing protein n=1 Tax=Smittium mucronatum TaxID=133383 RepID=A0A1R0GZH8_9FUNG|nr:hypothetical protein AYI68_g3594 [Smittium mucronatum]